VQDATTASGARLDVGPPKLFRAGAVVIVSAYGLLVMLPVLISILAISVMHFGLLTLILPVAAVAFATWFLPCGFGNPFILRLVRSLHPASQDSPEGFVVQLTLEPRLRTGLRALLEDADDVGWLSFTGSELRFQGDSVQLSVPLEQVRELKSRNIGWRGLFLYGPRSTFVVPGLPQVQSFQLAERSSCLLPGSRRRSRELFERLAKCQSAS
jgi:hypothetical protein